jgi:hypothetical protein
VKKIQKQKLSSRIVILGALALHCGPAFANTEGTYTVPASDAMSEAATFPTNKARFRVESADVARLVYELPNAIDGAEPQRFVLRGSPTPDGTWKLIGSGAEAECTATAREAECRMTYDDNLVIQDDEADAWLATQNLSAVEMAVARLAREELKRQGVGIIRAQRN